MKNRGFWVRRLVLQRWVPYALLVLGCVLSVTAAWYVSATSEARARAAFVTDAEQARHQISVRVNTYLEVIRAAAALLASSNETNPAEFRVYVRNLELPARYPGIEGIGFSQRIRRRDLRWVTRALDLDGVRNLRVWPRSDSPEYHPIIFVEPMDTRYEGAIGFDMSADPVRRVAMERARDSGEPTLSAKLSVVQPFERDSPPSLVLYVPVYRTGATVETMEQRRRALVGFVFSPFQTSTLFTNIVAERAPSVAFEVYDGAAVQRAALLHRSAAAAGEPPRYQSAQVVQLAGRSWLVLVKSVGAAGGVLPQTAKWTMTIGLLLSLMVVVIMRVQVGAWESAARHEAELEASERALRESESQLRDMVRRERDARTQAQAADRSKDEFLATLSHELRTPLNAVLGWLTMVRTGVVREERRLHALEVIERNARLQAQLIDDLLDVSRIVTGKLKLDLQPMTVASVVSAVVESLRPAADAAGVHLHEAIVPGTGRIRGDAARVQQIAWNLLSNAIKFTPAGGHVAVTLTDDGPDVQLSVRDTGVGIDAEFLPHAFERFRQADSSTTRTHTGVGLGLAITRHLVELHGGSITAHSDGPERGATFVVRFPEATAPNGTSLDATHAASPASPRLEGVRVLIVDDDADTREMLSEALGASGAQVITAEGSRQALEQLAHHPTDVLISDIGMPDMDGFSLIRHIRSTPGESRGIPAIALTAYAHDSTRDKAIDAGYQMHFAKPVELATLQTEVARLLALQASDSSRPDAAPLGT